MGFLAKFLPTPLKNRLLRSLSDGEDKFSRVFHTSADWIVITRLHDGLIVEANQGFQAISGYSPAEVIGHPMAQFNVWVHAAQRAQLVDEMMRTGIARDTLVQLRRRDGTVRDCMVNSALVALEGQTRSHAVWIARDVTEQNAVHEQFTAAFRLTPDFMSISRLSDGKYVEVNEAFERITGLRRAQVLGRTATEMNIWHDPRQRDALVRTLQAQGSVHDYLILINAHNNQVREALVNAAVFEARGERYMIALLRDVTGARKAERALQESEARFSRLFAQSPLPMCYSSSSDNYGTTQWNQAWFEAFGFTPEQAQGKSGQTLNIWVNPQDRTRVLSSHADSKSVEAEMRRADGEIRWMSVSTRVFAEAERTLYVSTYFDLTERRRNQQQIQQLNAQLEARVAQRTVELQDANQELSDTLDTLKMAKDQLVQSEKLAALGALVAGVAHELNTPIGNGLTVASSLEHRTQEFARMLDTGMKRSDLQRFLQDTETAADILVRNLTRAGALVASFKQVAVDQTSAHRRRFSLSAVVAEILVTLQPSIRKTACNVTAHIDEGLWMESFPGPLGQVITNLVNNAMVHGFDAGQAGNIRIAAHTIATDTVELQVQDDGRGIDPDDLNRVFDPFFTTRLGQGGSGLGLHIVHNIVTGVLGGQIEAQSQPGQGATFVLRLPLQAPQGPDVESLAP